ncbi:MAG: hypothetical protein WBB45_01550 [Cyclobacteriaceae bacterium]
MVICLPASYSVPIETDKRALNQFNRTLRSEFFMNRIFKTDYESMIQTEQDSWLVYEIIARVKEGDLSTYYSIALNLAIYNATYQESIPSRLFTVKESPATTEELKAIAEKYRVQLVLAIPDLTLKEVKNRKTVEASLKLYDHYTDSIAIDTVLTADKKTEMTAGRICRDNSYICAYQNLMGMTMSALMPLLSEVSTGLKEIIALNQARGQALMTDYEFARADTAITNLLKNNLEGIEEGNHHIVHMMVGPEKEKFVAFILAENENKGKKLFVDNDKTYIGYVVSGINDKGQWYIDIGSNVGLEEDELEIAGRELLLRWMEEKELFEEGTAWFSDEFWEKGPFARIPDLSTADVSDLTEDQEKALYIYGPLAGEYYLTMKQTIANRAMAYGYLGKDMEDALAPRLIVKASLHFDKGFTQVDTEQLHPFFSPSGTIMILPLLVNYEIGPDRVYYLVYFTQEGRLFMMERKACLRFM